MPAFARRTGRECQSCHFRPPELNLEGQFFLYRGLRVEPPEKPSEDQQPADVSLPLGIPLGLKWANYLSAVGHEDFVSQTGTRPYFDAGGLDLWIAGPIDRHWTGLINPSFDAEEGGSDVDSGYGQYVNHWADKFISSRFGQRLPFSILLDQGGPSMTLSTPVVLSTPAATGNTWTPTSFLRSVEVGAVSLPSSNVYFSAGNPRLDDSQTSLPGFENHIDLCADAAWFTGFMNSSITAYGYWGHAWLSPAAADNPFHRGGAFFTIYSPRTKSTIGFLTGSDKAINGASLGSSGGFGLLEYLIDDQWSAYFRYDWLRQNLDTGGNQKTWGPVIGLSYWAATQVWLTMEYQSINVTQQRATNILTVQLNWAF